MTRPDQLFHWLRSTLQRMAHRLAVSDSPWERVVVDVPAAAFGPGSRTPFARYFDGDSGVRVTSIDDIVEWLGRCEYITDTEQFHEADVWQDPCAFERRQRGDCEDFALWAWRKLTEIGVDAEFFVGRVSGGDTAAPIAGQHAWVVCRINGEEVLFEPAARDRTRMIRPLAAVKDAYIPHFAVDHRFVTCAFIGCLLTA